VAARRYAARIFAFMSTYSRCRPEQAVILLFFRSLRHRNSRIPAQKKESVADNFLQKQQKQLSPSKELAGKDVWIQ
jgi:hypothetical protein